MPSKSFKQPATVSDLSPRLQRWLAVAKAWRRASQPLKNIRRNIRALSGLKPHEVDRIMDFVWDRHEVGDRTPSI